MSVRFADRITTDGSSDFAAVAGRYHLSAGLACPWSHRVTIQRALNGLTDVVSLSFVDDLRDGRGCDGHVPVPTLWDRSTGRVVSDDFRTIGIDFATVLADELGTSAHTYRAEHSRRIEDLDAWLGPTVNHAVSDARRDLAARGEMLDAFEVLDTWLAEQRYLVGYTLTEADVRLWVTLIRFDVAANAGGVLLPGGLPEFPNLWAYARDLYGIDGVSVHDRLRLVHRPRHSPPRLERTN